MRGKFTYKEEPGSGSLVSEKNRDSFLLHLYIRNFRSLYLLHQMTSFSPHRQARRGITEEQMSTARLLGKTREKPSNS